jgi:2-methylfumaryl-CoA isomerase
MTERSSGILAGLRVVEVSAFVAAPLGGATLAAMGADVIRVDPIGGGIDAGRWPLVNGRSLYWAGLNQGKRSLTLNLRSDQGRDLLAQLVTQHEDGCSDGILLTNLGVPPWLSYERLAERRPDLIMLVISGSSDGGTAVDYTVNAALGFPFITGPEGYDGPVNHVLPAWDALTGYLAATALLAAERHRSLTSQGQRIDLSLMDVGLSVSSHLGLLAEAELVKEPRQRYGNDVYGSFGRDFVTVDGRRVMLLALTERQWRSVCDATGLGDTFAALERRLGLDFRLEGNRFSARAQISALIEPWIAAQSLEAIRHAFDGAGVLWGPYQTFKQLMQDDVRASPTNPIMTTIKGEGLSAHRAAGSAVRFAASPNPKQSEPALLGQHTEAVLRDVLKRSAEEIEELRFSGVIG